MTDKETARAKIAQLVERFQAIPKKERDDFTEQQTRVSFILPLFEALGWETSNPAEMSAEEQISRGFVDFGFYLNGVPVFYLETKRVREDISKPEYMKQAINYAYLKGVTWAVLTDFEDLLVFNADWEDPNPEKTRLFELSYTQYANGGFEDLWLLSKPSLAAREIDRVAERYGKKAKREPVTKVLFKQLTEWRYQLFQNIAGLKTTLWATDPHEVDNAVQKLIDRLIFIRSMEDRGVEEPRLQPLIRQFNKGVQFRELIKIFRGLNEVYNSNLFAQSNLDLMELHDPGLLRDIISGLYKVPDSTLARYDFNAIDADVLGAVYEQYLGFKAQDPAAKQKLDPRKREKRKSQGIYYTPKFVVRYIVQQTVGRKLAEGVDAHSLRILDPACGSGSFLIEAFDVLDRHIAQKEPDLPAHERRQRILRENLYGVDLDDQAVEVTRLNLALRAAYARERLPYLTNIMHGNSLIDDRAVAGETAFDWLDRFSDVMNAGGFDIVIGNPPWGAKYPADYVEYLERAYVTGNVDTYAQFIEKGIGVLKREGNLGFITPDTFMRKDGLKAIREFLLETTEIQEMIETGPVFPEVRDTWCVVFSAKNKRPRAEHVINHKNISRFVVSSEERLAKFGAAEWDNSAQIKQSVWLHSPNMVFGYCTSEREQSLIAKINTFPQLGSLEETYRVSRGEEGSKFNVEHDSDGDYRMIIPEDVERYYVDNGKTIKSSGLTLTNVSYG